MQKVIRFLRFGSGAALLALLGLSFAPVNGQMVYRVSVYADSSFSDDFVWVYGTGSTVDNSSGCWHSGYQTTVSVYTPDGRWASSTQGMTTNVSIATNGWMGTYTTVSTVQFRCSCFPYGPVGGGGPASQKNPTEVKGCSVGFSPGQFNASCSGQKKDGLFSVITTPTTAPSCLVSGVSCSFSNSGEVEWAADPTSECHASLGGGVVGHVYFFAGSGETTGTTVGSIGIASSFTLNGAAVNRNDGVAVVCQ